MSAEPELVFTDEELTLLAGMAGEPYFPGARAAQLDESGWEAVARGLLARGILRDDEPPAANAIVDAVLGVVLFADRSLRMTIVYAPGEGDSRHEVLWLKGNAVVRQTTTPEGVHRFSTGQSSSIGALLEAVLDFPSAAGSQPGPSRTLPERDYVEALELLRSDGAPASADRHPAAAGYLEALADARRLTSVESRRSVGEDLFEGEELTLVESPQHGLWLARDEPAGDEPTDGSVVLQRIAVDMARERVTALVGAPA